MALPVSFFVVTYADNTLKSNNTPELTVSRWPITTLTAANVVAQTAFQDAFITAVNAITIGNLYKKAAVFSEVQVSVDPASTSLAQRENKWFCRFHDVVTNQKMTRSIGTADLTLLTDHSEFLDITADEGLAFKTAFDDMVKSEYDATHGVSLDSVQFVGRST